jgi:hypothetical protein
LANLFLTPCKEYSHMCFIRNAPLYNGSVAWFVRVPTEKATKLIFLRAAPKFGGRLTERRTIRGGDEGYCHARPDKALLR